MMKILLDTHILWWFLNDNNKLSKSAKDAIVSAKNKKYVSIVTIWEVAIKIGIKKLDFKGGINNFIESIIENGFNLLEIKPAHIKIITDLPLIHRDPFDRMIIAQTISENMALLTADTSILKYDVNIF